MQSQKLYVEGGHRINGEISCHGAKNSALPILAATLIPRGESIIHNCPHLSDVHSSLRILSSLGCSFKRNKSDVTIDSKNVTGCEVKESLMLKMRSSIVFLGAILARLGHARISLPGGCELGPRPIDIHLSSFEKMGVKIIEDHGVLDCKVGTCAVGADITLPLPSVGVTENVMLLASTANGTTTLRNCAKEPEISDLANYLNSCGAKIHGAGTHTVVIEGVKELYPCEHSVIPDRIVAATYMGAAALTGGELMINSCRPEDMHSTVSLFEQMGASIYPQKDRLYILAKKPLKAIKTVRTGYYPGFPTDCQPIITACLCKAEGTSLVIENIFDQRFSFVGELRRMGADIKSEGRVCITQGVKTLSGTTVTAHDLRAGASLVLAGLSCEGTTTVSGVEFIDRGYENIEQSLRSVGAVIKRSAE